MTCSDAVLVILNNVLNLPCRHTYQSDSSLVISQLRAEDAGTYMCIISNGRTEHRQIQLRIKGHPFFFLRPELALPPPHEKQKVKF